MDSSLNIMLHGPPLASWDPTPAANAWFPAGTKGWRAVGKRRWRKDEGKPGARREEADPVALAGESVNLTQKVDTLLSNLLEIY